MTRPFPHSARQPSGVLYRFETQLTLLLVGFMVGFIVAMSLLPAIVFNLTEAL